MVTRTPRFGISGVPVRATVDKEHVACGTESDEVLGRDDLETFAKDKSMVVYSLTQMRAGR